MICYYFQLKQSARLLLWKAENHANVVSADVKNVCRKLTWTILKRDSWISVAVFNDSVALIEKCDVILFNFPLVWTEVKEENSEYLVRIFNPENEFYIRFKNFESKNKFVSAIRQWRYFNERYRIDNSLERCVIDLPKQRHGNYKFSSDHPNYANCSYSGYWLDGKPHGRGHLVYANSNEYRGNFVDGRVEGFGKMLIALESSEKSSKLVPNLDTENLGKEAKFDMYTGFWLNGLLNGLAHIKFSNGDTYKGYMHNGEKHGFGVLHTSKNGETKVYLGGWCCGMRSGYGVFTDNSTYQEGLFENDRLVHGCLTMPASDGYSELKFEGDFEEKNIIGGKGTLYLNSSERIEGQMTGDIIRGEVRITNAIFSRINTADMTPSLMSFWHESCKSPRNTEWMIDANEKWKEFFRDFLLYDLLIPVHLDNVADISEFVDDQCRTMIWNSLASNIAKIRLGMNEEEIRVTFDENLEKIPEYTAQWCYEYYEMVQQYWNLVEFLRYFHVKAMKHKYHPLHRLVYGLIEVFTGSYGAVGTHQVVYSQAVCELFSILSRIYSIIRLLFNSLPRTLEMFTPVPAHRDHNLGTENTGFQSQEKLYIFLVDLNEYYLFRDLWPINVENINDLDAPLIRATARKKFYHSAIQTLQQISAHFNPASKLAVLIDTFKEIGAVSLF
ncbi:unnamed protein product [Thelazia callipaeda]|uniref:VPS9 domain-containing protein n=1 Tax=Thelazia callipaeda TaxID=103827 RepID=A0A0N5CLP9_THECL|nr:unnamed protein product [Thelazia callipaeda]